MAQLKAVQDKILTDVSEGLFQDESAFVAERFLTSLGVKQRSGIVGAHGTNHLRVHANAMAGRGEAPRVSLMQVDKSTTYQIKGHGLEDIVTEEDYDDFENPFDAERDKTLLLTYAMLIAKEVALSTQMQSTSVITNYTTLTGASQFSDFANSDPIGVFNTGRETVRGNCGFYPNAAALEAQVFEKLRIHPQIWDRLGFKYNQSGQLTQDNVGQALNVEQLFVMEGVYNSAAEGQADVIAPIWGKNMWLAYVAPNPALKQKTLGYHVFSKSKGVRRVFKYAVQNPPGSTAIICRDDYDMLISEAECAYGIFSAVA